MKQEKEKPKRKLPKKSQRAKRRYLLFSMKNCTGKQAFDVLMSCFSMEERKELGAWFIEYDPKTGLGILRCKLSGLQKTRKMLEKIPAKHEAKTLKTSGTLKALKGK